MSQPYCLTKTSYLEFRRCPRESWLSHRSPERRELSLEAKHRREQGYDVQRLARKMSIFKSGIVNHERTFQTNEFSSKSDIVIVDPTTGDISIYEVKSGASVKEEYLFDVAFQMMVAKANGFTVAHAYLITVDTTYVRSGEIDPDSNLKVDEVTEQVRGMQLETIANAEAAIEYLKTEPVPSIAEYCDAKLDCAFIRHHFTDIPEYNVTKISRLNKDKLADLLGRGITDIRQVPPDFKLSDKQRRQVDLARSGESYIDRESIKAALDGLKYPLNFLDYESFNYAVPQYDGIRPYQQMLFQYSLHTIAAPGAEPTHRFRLARSNEMHPAREIVEGLYADLSASVGTIVVWNRAFEKMCTSQLALLYPEFCDFLQTVNSAIFDLMTIVSNGWYIHPEFRGSASIKSVLPVLCPELRYDELDIGDGTTASIKWYHMVTKRFDDAECQRIYDGLFKYCHLDTLAMVRIWEFLKRESALSVPSA